MQSLNKIDMLKLKPEEIHELHKHVTGSITFVKRIYDNRMIYFRIHSDATQQGITAYFIPKNKNLDGDNLGNSTGFGKLHDLEEFGVTESVVGVDTMHGNNEGQNIFEMYLDAQKQIIELIDIDNKKGNN